MKATKPFIDVAVVVALEQELRAFFETFPSIGNLSTEDVLLHEVDTGIENLSMVLVQQNDMGHAEAGQAVIALLERYRIGLVVGVGIAGALSDDMHLGDVCYTGRVIDVYENSKAIDVDGDSSVLDLEFSPVFYETDTNITRSINFARSQPDMSAAYDQWVENQHQKSEELCPNKLPIRDGTLKDLERPSSLNGSIVCGMVSKSKKYNERMKGLDRRVLAIETESGAIFRQAKAASVQALTIRAISDYADSNKTKLENSTRGSVRELAACNAVSFFKMQLNNPYFQKQLVKLRPGTQTSLDLFAREDNLPPVDDPLEKVAEYIDGQLREFSPEYRLQPKGYKIPGPRVRRNSSYQSDIAPEYFPPTELRDALKVDKRILISVPRSYPDKSLPWVIAHDLLDAELNGKQLVPIVVDGNRFAPPARGFFGLTHFDVAAISQNEGLQPVFIVEDIPLHSQSRIKFLKTEVSEQPTEHFIFLSSSSPNILNENDFRLELSLAVYEPCDISFQEISNFIQTSFEMPGTQAEVVAKKLWDAFQAFDLSAHPTYFAGIPRETLMALLHANQRAELLQLAVDGFLTILVAEDEAEVALSRTTRSRFLSDLVVELHLELKRYTPHELIALVETFSKQQDFDINPISFIKTFEDKGILHFENDLVSFSLPFIERYLLARRLSDQEELAMRYFDTESITFDPQVFDLYVEMGAHDSIKTRVFDEVSLSTDNLSSSITNIHILLTNELNPPFGKSKNRVERLQNRLNQARSDVQSGKSDIEKKQQLLDLSDRVRESQVRHVRIGDKKDDNEINENLGNAIKNFLLGVMLLGSGAETLLADEKRSMVVKLTELGAVITHVWTKRVANYDFSGFKEQLAEDDIFNEYVDVDDPDLTKEDVGVLISDLVDMLEASMLSVPLHRILNLLCDQARSPVLARSLEFAIPEDAMAKLLHAAWLTDVNVSKGKSKLLKEGKSLPNVHFLRMCMSMHCLSRVFWDHWKQGDRISLLSVADSFLKPISSNVDKRTLLRKIRAD